MDGTLLNISNLFQQRGLTILPRIAQEEQTGFKLQTFGLPIVEKKITFNYNVLFVFTFEVDQ